MAGTAPRSSGKCSWRKSRVAAYAAREISPYGVFRSAAEAGALEEEGLAQELGDREDELHVGHVGQDVLDHALGPQNSALLRARRAEAP
jgi:hypothetical protein